MGLYVRDDSPYIWKKYDIDPVTKKAPRKPASTKIFKDAPTKAQRDQNWRDAEVQYAQDLIDVRQNKVILPAITFADYAQTWYVPNNTMHLRGKEIHTINTLMKDFGAVLLSEFSIDRVRVWRAEKMRSGDYQASTINHYVSVLTKMLTRAVPTYLETNPLAALKHGSNRRQLERLDEQEFEARAFTDEEFRQFMQTIDKHDQIADIPKAEGLALAYCAIETLVRRGSLLRLTWADDRETRFVTKDTKVSRGRAKAPKSKPITPHMRQCLDDLPRETPGGLIFPSFHKPSGFEQYVTRWFSAVCELANLPYGRAAHGLTFHSFRHTGATWYLKAGHSVRAVMTLGGWSNAQLFLDTYVHVSEDEIAAMANSLFPPKLRVIQGGKDAVEPSTDALPESRD